jgi:hypothetical protein
LTRPGRPPPYGEVRAKSMCFCESRRTTKEGTLTIWRPTLGKHAVRMGCGGDDGRWGEEGRWVGGEGETKKDGRTTGGTRGNEGKERDKEEAKGE